MLIKQNESKGILELDVFIFHSFRITFTQNNLFISNVITFSILIKKGKLDPD